ncbi:hypothetical protein WJX73_004480 [Symbiochloris irregularis]|uniref:Uncharacterized protein n=1 Tax=Symbiochloris irregularis TaxID=706552 RepID=A0AAW1PM85_9CHLO
MEQLQGLLAVFNGANKGAGRRNELRTGAQLINAIGTLDSEHFGEFALGNRSTSLDPPALQSSEDKRVCWELRRAGSEGHCPVHFPLGLRLRRGSHARADLQLQLVELHLGSHASLGTAPHRMNSLPGWTSKRPLAMLCGGDCIGIASLWTMRAVQSAARVTG